MSDPQSEFSEVLRLYGDVAYRMAYQLTGGRESEARDLVQEVFLRIWKHWDAPRPTSMKGWMYRVLRNLYIDTVRHRQRHPAISIQEDFGTSIPLEDRLQDTCPSTHHQLERQDVQKDVRVALGGLQEEFRTPVMLCDLEGLRYEDIARILNCPIGTVRSRIHRGRLELRRLLRAHGPKEALV